MENPEVFKHFDLASDASDHYFLRRSCGKLMSGRVHKCIMKEWKILEENLPESIYVRVYETHIDLVRVATVGAAGTPYHDGLFFFDILFPSDYPNYPPKVNYRTFGYDINPNLHDHEVCLSLLGAWVGLNKSERWDPSISTLLQVLLSIQALVLTEMPLFNSPLAPVSRAYNETVFIRTCYITFLLIQKPPKNFKQLVTCHFRERAHVILAACSEYANERVRVGYYGCEFIESGSSSSSTVKVSDDFKNKMERFYPRLVEALQSTGAHLRDINKNVLIIIPSLTSNSESSSRLGILFKKVQTKIKQFLDSWNDSGTKKLKISEIEGMSLKIIRASKEESDESLKDSTRVGRRRKYKVIARRCLGR